MVSSEMAPESASTLPVSAVTGPACTPTVSVPEEAAAESAAVRMYSVACGRTPSGPVVTIICSSSRKLAWRR
jgi:hypothetical protein